MIVVRLMGGHSNQLFQYATGRRLAEHLGVELYLDKSWFKNVAAVDTKRFYELGNYNIDAKFISPRRFALVEDFYNNNAKTRIYNITKGLVKPRLLHYREKSHSFDKGVLKLSDNVYLDGFWQNEKYFIDIRALLLEEIELKTPLTLQNNNFLKEIKTSESISLHIRREDYVSNPEANKFHGLAPLEYYEAAYRLIKRKLPRKRLHIFVFSTDMEWSKKNIKFDCPITYVEGNKNGAEDMRLMKHCKHNIMANSSFSWWGAWLNQNPDKIIIAPKVWFKDKAANKATEIVPADWIRL